MFKKLLAGIGLALFLCTAGYGGNLRIVAAENFYGQIAHQIGGPYVQVTSILHNPQQDPHLFSSSPAIAKSIANADLIIYNGLGYDDWINNLITTTPAKTQSIVVGDLAGRRMGDNPHIWYDPKIMLIYATDLTAQLSRLDSPHQAYYHQQLELFKQDYQTLLQKIQQLRQQYHDRAVIATEPVFNDMARELGLAMHGLGFQLSVMNGTEPNVSDTKDFEDQLKNHTVQVLIFNNQVFNPITDRMQKIAEQAGIPVVGVSETEPAQQNYFTWMTTQLNALADALARKSP